MFCLLLSGCSKEEVLEKYNAVVEKVGEVQLTNDINLQGKRDYGEDYYTGTYQAEYKKFSDTEYLFGGTTIERAAGKQGSYLSLDPDRIKAIIKSVETEIGKLESLGKSAIIITSPIVRMYFKKMTEDYFKDLIVLSYNEVESNVELQSVGMVTA